MAAAKKSGGGWGKWKALGVLGVATFLAVETGWAGFGWAKLRSAVYPNDTALLGWVPGDTTVVAVVDPHQLGQGALGGEGSTARSAIDRTRNDVKRVTGIDLAFDVDKLVVTPSLVVARGRFDGKKLADKLVESHYTLAEHKGETYLVRAGEDALAAIGGSILLYGDEASVKAAIDAQKDDTSLEKNDPVKARLAQVGWNHPLLVTVRITDEKPSVRALLTGATGPRAVTVGVTTLSGLDLDAIVETPSPSAGAELAKLLDEKRKDAGSLAPSAGAEVTPILSDVAKKATVAADPQTGAVKAHAHLDDKQLDTLVKNARSALPFAEMYKNFRLFQLLGG
jgi:hypothetical protein